MLAAAGVHRLGLTERITSYFSFEQMCPAVGQGALGIEIRADDPRGREAVARLDHLATHQAVRAERAVLRRLGGGCQVPIAAHAVVEDGNLQLQALVANLDGTRVIRAQTKGPASDPEALGASGGGRPAAPRRAGDTRRTRVEMKRDRRRQGRNS